MKSNVHCTIRQLVDQARLFKKVCPDGFIWRLSGTGECRIRVRKSEPALRREVTMTPRSPAVLTIAGRFRSTVRRLESPNLQRAKGCSRAHRRNVIGAILFRSPSIE